MAKDQEVELQTRVEHVNGLMKLLKTKGTFISSAHEHDRYFSPAVGSYLDRHPAVEWLRIRSKAGISTLTYKHHRQNAAGLTTHCDEYETVVSDAAQMEKVLEALHFTHIATVDKKRDTWRIDRYIIAIDKIEGLGDFVEVELCEHTDDPEGERQAMVAFLKSHGCGTLRANRVGYPYMLLFPDKIVEEVIN